MGDVLILFRNSKKLKAFDKQLVENKIIFKKEKNNYLQLQFERFGK